MGDSARRPPLQPGERRPCEACGEMLVGALTVNKKVAPIEMKIDESGNVWLGRSAEGTIICATLGGPLREAAVKAGITLHVNHFATCPERERFQR